MRAFIFIFVLLVANLISCNENLGEQSKDSNLDEIHENPNTYDITSTSFEEGELHFDSEKINVDTYDPTTSQFEHGTSRLQKNQLKDKFEDNTKTWNKQELEPLACGFMLNISQKEFKALLKENKDRQNKGKKPRISDLNTQTTYSLVKKYLDDAFVVSSGSLTNLAVRGLLNVHNFDKWVYDNHSNFGDDLAQFTPTEDNIEVEDRQTMKTSEETITANDKTQKPKPEPVKPVTIDL